MPFMLGTRLHFVRCFLVAAAMLTAGCAGMITATGGSLPISAKLSEPDFKFEFYTATSGPTACKDYYSVLFALDQSQVEQFLGVGIEYFASEFGLQDGLRIKF